MRDLVARIAQIASLYPEREALVCPNRTLTYADLASAIDATKCELHELGISRLAIYANNSADWAILDLAASAAGIVVVPIPLFFSASQTEHLITNSGIQMIFADRAGPLPARTQVASQTLKGNYLRVADSAHSAGASYSKVTYTSGSTGQPKGACLRSETMMSIVTSLSDALLPSQLRRHLALLPFATLLENVAGIYLPLWMGRAVVIDDPANLGLSSNHEFDPVRFAEQVARHQIESVILLPQMLKLLLEADVTEHLSGMKFMAVGGGKVAPDLLWRAQELALPVFEGYGLTECGSCVALNTPSANAIGSVGKPLPHAQVRIGANGEVFVTGAAMEGYLQDAPAPSEVSTGDAGFIDAEGFLHITGRIKNVIVSSFGRNISPEWVESFFLADPRIQQLAVFGEAQPHLSAVFVVDNSLEDRNLAELVQNINADLPDYARIISWTRTDCPFSVANGRLTQNGKIRREVIAEDFTGDAGSGVGMAAA